MSERSWWPVIAAAVCVGLLWLVWPPAAPSSLEGPPTIAGDSAYGLTPLGPTPLGVEQSALSYDLSEGTDTAGVTATYRVINPTDAPVTSLMGFGLDRGSSGMTFSSIPVATADGKSIGLVRRERDGLNRWDFSLTVPAGGATEVRLTYTQIAAEAERLTAYPRDVLVHYWPGGDLWNSYGPVEVAVQLAPDHAERFRAGEEFRPDGAGKFTASYPGFPDAPLSLVFQPPGLIFGLDPDSLKMLATLAATALMAGLAAQRMPGDYSGAAILAVLLSAVAEGAALILPARPLGVYQWLWVVLLTALASIAGVTFAALLQQPTIEETRPSE